MKIIPKNQGMPPKIIVFGGSGFIGTHLLRRLVKEENVSIVSIDIKPPYEKLDGVAYHIGDVRNLKGIEINGKITRIYDLAALCVIPKYEEYEYYDVNVMGAISIAGFARQYSVDDIVFVSSMATYGAGERPLPETAKQNPDNAYGRSKLIAERVYGQWQLENKQRKLIICRPAVIFGHGENGNFTKLARLLQYGFFIYPGRKNTIKACYYVKDLVEDLVFISSNDREASLVFNACYDKLYTIEEIVHNLKVAMNKTVYSFVMPNWALSLLAKLLQFFDFAGLGIHPDRIKKLVISTNLEPVFLRERGVSRGDRLLFALQDWKKDSEDKWN